MSIKKLLTKFFKPFDEFVFNYMVRAGLIKPFLPALIGAIGSAATAAAPAVATAVATKALTGGSKKSSTAKAIEQAVPERTAEQQLNDIVTIYFGPEAVGKYKGLYDPKLIKDLSKIDAKSRRDLSIQELNQLNLLLDGTTSSNPAYQQSRNKIDAFSSIQRKLKQAGNNPFARKFKDSLTGGEAYYLYQANLISSDRTPTRRYSDNQIKSLLARSKKELSETPQTIKTDGLNQIVKEQSKLIGDITRSETRKTRTANVEDMRRLGKAVTDAYRNADPASRQIADLARSRAVRGDASLSQLNQVGRDLLGSDVRVPSFAEKALQKRGLSDINAQREAASSAERQLLRMGMSEGDLSDTETESLLFGRGSEFIESTGELSPLERRRATQAVRQASLARGREMDQGSLFNELLARSSEELNKREREIALGSDLLGQQAELRRLRLSQGGGFLKDAEDLAAQKRLEQRQRQAMGIGALTTVDNMAARRQSELLQRQQLGANLLGQAEDTQSNRINQAFDLNRRMAPDLSQIFLGTTTPATTGSLGQARNIGSGAGFSIVDPNAGFNIDAQNYANRLNRAGAIAKASAADRAGTSSLFSDVTSSVLPSLFDNIFDTKMDFGF